MHQASELRASDAEREQAVALLRSAVSDGRLPVEELEERLQSAYTVRTRRELELLVADVSTMTLAGTPARAGEPGSGSLGRPGGAGASGLSVREGPGGSRWIVSVMGGHDRRGRWRVAPRCTVVNVMGGSDLDLNDAELAAADTQVTMVSIMGGGEIRVPEGVEVHLSNFAFMGGNDIQLGEEVTVPGGPVIRIRLVSVMGGASVKRGRKRSRAERRRERELAKAEQPGAEQRGELER